MLLPSLVSPILFVLLQVILLVSSYSVYAAKFSDRTVLEPMYSNKTMKRLPISHSIIPISLNHKQHIYLPLTLRNGGSNSKFPKFQDALFGYMEDGNVAIHFRVNPPSSRDIPTPSPTPQSQNTPPDEPPDDRPPNQPPPSPTPDDDYDDPEGRISSQTHTTTPTTTTTYDLVAEGYNKTLDYPHQAVYFVPYTGRNPVQHRKALRTDQPNENVVIVLCQQGKDDIQTMLTWLISSEYRKNGDTYVYHGDVCANVASSNFDLGNNKFCYLSRLTYTDLEGNYLKAKARINIKNKDYYMLGIVNCHPYLEFEASYNGETSNPTAIFTPIGFEEQPFPIISLITLIVYGIGLPVFIYQSVKHKASTNQYPNWIQGVLATTSFAQLLASIFATAYWWLVQSQQDRLVILLYIRAPMSLFAEVVSVWLLLLCARGEGVLQQWLLDPEIKFHINIVISFNLVASVVFFILTFDVVGGAMLVISYALLQYAASITCKRNVRILERYTNAIKTVGIQPKGTPPHVKLVFFKRLPFFIFLYLFIRTIGILVFGFIYKKYPVILYAILEISTLLVLTVLGYLFAGRDFNYLLSPYYTRDDLMPTVTNINNDNPDTNRTQPQTDQSSSPTDEPQGVQVEPSAPPYPSQNSSTSRLDVIQPALETDDVDDSEPLSPVHSPHPESVQIPSDPNNLDLNPIAPDALQVVQVEERELITWTRAIALPSIESVWANAIRLAMNHTEESFASIHGENAHEEDCKSYVLVVDPEYQQNEATTLRLAEPSAPRKQDLDLYDCAESEASFRTSIDTASDGGYIYRQSMDNDHS